MATLPRIRLAVLDRQTVEPASAVQDWVSAVRIQVNRDALPSWNLSGAMATLKYVGKGAVAPAGYWQVAVLDDADQAGALGYHDLTADGLPLGKVFVRTSHVFGDLPSVVLSHEILEMLGDPFIALVVTDATDPTKFWARELCDAVEADALGYDIALPATTTKPARAVRVSDFVLPQYFNSLTGGAVSRGPFSFKNHLSGSVPALASGGYMAFVRNGVWSQVQQFAAREGTRAHAMEAAKTRLDGSQDRRRIRRQIPRAQWIRSTV